MKKYIFHVCILPIIFYKLAFPNTVVTVKDYYKGRFFNAHQSLWSPKVIMILIIMKIVSFTLKLSGWKANRKVRTKLKIVKTPIFSYRLDVLEIFNFIFHFSVIFFMHRSLLWFYTHTPRNSDGHRQYQTYFPQNHQSLSHLIGARFLEEIKVLHALLWDLEISRNWGKKWIPTYTTAVAYFSTIVQPFPIFRKLLIPSM